MSWLNVVLLSQVFCSRSEEDVSPQDVQYRHRNESLAVEGGRRRSRRRAGGGEDWGCYSRKIYGAEHFTSRPSWLIFGYDEALHPCGISTSSPNCPESEGVWYQHGYLYRPPKTTFIWRKPPYAKLPSHSWQEVMHQADPFGDEHYGAWFIYSPGSGIFFNLGDTIAFDEHWDAYDYFKVGDQKKCKGIESPKESSHQSEAKSSCDWNEEMCKLARKKGFESVQFLKHVDHVNYQCDTKNTGTAGLQYMGLEIVAAKLVGKYACATSIGAPPSVRSGWEASKACRCDNKKQFLNCQGVATMSDLSAKDTPVPTADATRLSGRQIFV